MSYTTRPERVARTHQALGEVNRLRLLEVLRAHPDGLSTADAAREVGLHQATAREHLELLVETGLADRAPERRSARGRPRVIYRVGDRGVEAADDGYRLLAEILASMVETSVRRPAGVAEAAGVAWGRSLVERARPLTRLPRAEAERRVTSLLDDLGFEPETVDDGEDRQVRLHRCPFREVAAEHRSVVCSAHLGLIKGALDELGVRAEDTTLEPLVTPTLCVARLGGRRR